MNNCVKRVAGILNKRHPIFFVVDDCSFFVADDYSKASKQIIFSIQELWLMLWDVGLHLRVKINNEKFS